MTALTHRDKNTKLQIYSVLSQVLSDTFLLYVKTLNFHWNIVDPRFSSLHALFEKQYEELAEANDEIAERMRALSLKAPGTLQQFQNLSTLEEDEGEFSGDQMIQLLYKDHISLADQMRASVDAVAKLGDDGTADLLIQRIRAHEKNAWMLKSHLPQDL